MADSPPPSSAPVAWGAVLEAAKKDALMELLSTLPRERWADQDTGGRTLLVYACHGNNVAAAVALLGHVDANARTNTGWTAAIEAAWNAQPRMLEVLCAAGADLRASSVDDFSALDVALHGSSSFKCVPILVANGVRLFTARLYSSNITPQMRTFERGVLCCREAVVALLRVKRASGGQLARWDKYLLAEMAKCVWTTRYAREWQLE